MESVPIVENIPFLQGRDDQDVLELAHEVERDIGAEDGIVL